VVGTDFRQRYNHAVPTDRVSAEVPQSGEFILARYNPLVKEERARRWYLTATEIESRKQEEERIRQENVRLEERTRIARELHDTLLQTFQSASLSLGTALYGVAQDSPAKPQLDRILEIMRQGIEEGRSLNVQPPVAPTLVPPVFTTWVSPNPGPRLVP
jgi:signal transduction histidine kinase